MTYTVSGGALNSTQTKPNPDFLPSQSLGLVLKMIYQQINTKVSTKARKQTGVSGKTRSAAILTSPGVDHFLSSDFRTFFIGCSTFCSHKSHADQLEILALRSTVKCHRSHQCWNEEKLHRKTYSYPPTDTHTL